jgi:hypothetical protein
VAAEELATLLLLLQDVQLTQQNDQRIMLDGSSFSTKAAYNSLHDQQADDITAYI